MATIHKLPVRTQHFEPTLEETTVRLKAAEDEFFRALVAHLRAEHIAWDRSAHMWSDAAMRLAIAQSADSHIRVMLRDRFFSWLKEEAKRQEKPGS